MTPAHAKVGSGKVTDSQVAFMVECYLRDSHFSRSLQEFRLEAARLLHPLRSVPKGARSLSAVLNDYVALKEEQISAAAEKARVEDLFHGLQEILSVYLSGSAKNAGPMGEMRSEALSPPPFASPAGVQQAQSQVLCESDAAALSVKTAACNMVQNAQEVDQHAKNKVSSHKRKSQGKSSVEPLQHGNSCVDLVKKARHGSTVKHPYSDCSAIGTVTMVDSNVCTTGTDCLMASKMVQPATPPMTMISCKSQQQQQALPCGATSESPQRSPSPTGAAQIVNSPKPSSHSTPLSSARGDGVGQQHQDPQTPPPSTKSSLVNVAFASVQVEETSHATTAPGKLGNVHQRRKTPVPHLPSATSHYALRAHKKSSEASCMPLSHAESNCAPKPTRKRAINSKCRLLDFSAAAANADPQVDSTLKQSNKATGISTSSCVDQNLPYSDSQQIIESSPASNCQHVPDLASSLEDLSKRELEATEFSLPCDGFSFEELFNLDLDTSLISELEDLATITGCDTDPSSCQRSSDIAELSFPSEAPSGGVLTEIDNLIHSDDAAALASRVGCPSGLPFKHRKPAAMAGHDSLDDKENIHTLVASH